MDTIRGTRRNTLQNTHAPRPLPPLPSSVKLEVTLMASALSYDMTLRCYRISCYMIRYMRGKGCLYKSLVKQP